MAHNTINGMVSTLFSAILRETEPNSERLPDQEGMEVGRQEELETNSASENEFTLDSLYRQTVRSFSPRRSSVQGRKRERGRPARTVPIRLFLLDEPLTVVPKPEYQKKLTESGLGSPKAPLSNILLKVVDCARLSELHHLPISRLVGNRLHIILRHIGNYSAIPNEIKFFINLKGIPLELVGFHVGKSTKSKKLVRIEVESMRSLKTQVGKGVLFIIPKSKLNLPHRDPPVQSLDINASISSVLPLDPEPEAISLALSQAQSSLERDNIPSESLQLSSITPPQETQNVVAAVPSLDESDDSFPVIQCPRRRLAARHARRTIRRWCNRASIGTPNTSSVTSEDSSILSVAVDTASVNEDELQIIDLEDEQLQLALEASLQEQEENGLPSASRTVSEVLQEIKQTVVSKLVGKTSIVVMRRKVLESAFRAMSRPAFDLNGNLYIKFSGEIGEDYGGPRREFFRLALKELQQSCLFEGSEGNSFFTHNLEALEENKYLMAGQLVALSLIHDGPGFHCLNGELLSLMLGEDVNLENFNLDCLPDQDAKEILSELSTITDASSRDAFLVKHGQWLIENGITSAWRLRIEDKRRLFATLVKQLIYFRCMAEVNAFTKGLNTVGELWKVIQQNSCMKELFCKVLTPLTKEIFMKICRYEWSEEGSNKKMAEEETVYAWELFLQEIDDKEVDVSFGDLLCFITGADHIPPLGFPNPIEIAFYPVEPNVKRLPFASTCGLTISLPRGASPEELKDLLYRALKESHGFLKV